MRLLNRVIWTKNRHSLRALPVAHSTIANCPYFAAQAIPYANKRIKRDTAGDLRFRAKFYHDQDPKLAAPSRIGSIVMVSAVHHNY
ncbi:hypothetical protein AAFX91_24315 [Bradyrhizobium sp. 31Argb]|uniref:hypothetical protein n=1 Tax=Bradyrhizobium sp. 31Argb TaxID=3141247 RepID=UPI00374859BE